MVIITLDFITFLRIKIKESTDWKDWSSSHGLKVASASYALVFNLLKL